MTTTQNGYIPPCSVIGFAISGVLVPGIIVEICEEF